MAIGPSPYTVEAIVFERWKRKHLEPIHLRYRLGLGLVIARSIGNSRSQLERVGTESGLSCELDAEQGVGCSKSSDAGRNDRYSVWPEQLNSTRCD